MKDTEQDLFLCDCFSTEHQIIFSYSTNENDDWNMVFMHVHLNKERGFFRRLFHAIKYIFGYRSKYGDFDEFIFKPEDANKLYKIATHLKRIEKRLKEAEKNLNQQEGKDKCES